MSLTPAHQPKVKFHHLKIHPKAKSIIETTDLGKPQGFGSCLMPLMVVSDYKNGAWGPLELLPYGNWEFDPSSKGLHYGQQIFEGMKSYWVDRENPSLFRWEENFHRFNASAKRMAMPEISKDYFFESLLGIVDYCRRYIPRQTGQFLYLRPFMVATEKHLGIAPASEYRYGLIASATESYLTGEVSVLVERNYVRASIGGTGFAKTGGNYARGMIAAIEAKNLGHQQILWLDATDRDGVEEMSGMNFFIVRDGELVTPSLRETILNGTTRNTILQVAKEIGLVCKEEHLSIKKVLQDIENKKITEAFACGTASTIAPIKTLAERDGRRYSFQEFPGKTTLALRSYLLDLFEGRKIFKSEWLYEIKGV